MTPAEAALWEHLKSRRFCGVKVRAQHALGRFIVDFCCPAERLVIELDGGYHDRQIERDLERSEVLIAHDYRVLRFRNEEVLERMEEVLATIRDELVREG